jgi:hypothetical protein
MEKSDKGQNLQNRIPTEDNVPRILHNISRNLVRQVIIQHPVVHALVIAQRTLENLVARHGKLRATWRRNRLRHIIIAKQFLPRRSVILFAGLTTTLGQAPEWLHCLRTAGRGLAAQVDKTLRLDERTLKGVHGLEVDVVGGVDVPAVVVGVHKDDGSGEVVVVVDNELEVWQSLAAFVFGSAGDGVGVVDGINEVAPTGRGALVVSSRNGNGKKTQENTRTIMRAGGRGG